MKKKNQGLLVKNNATTPMLPGVQNLPYAEKRLNKKTGAVIETAKATNGYVGQRKTLKTGGVMTKILKAPEYSNKTERNESIRDFAKNGANQIENALAHDVSQTTVSNVLNNKNRKV